MTKKEAIVFLDAIKRGLHKTGKDHPYRDDLIPKMKEALCIAIEEMKAESCKDAISRKSVDALVDELARAISDERLHISRGRSTGEIMQDIIDLPSVIPRLKTGEWIPVSERLPEEETDVFICNANGDRAISRGSYSTEVKDDFIWYTSGWRFGKVIAWMPLPEPYKAESDGKC